MKENHRVMQIGRSIPRQDALNKVRGQERYAIDHYPENFVWAGVKRAGIAHARIKAIDTASAEALPGVLAVLTHADVKGTNRQGVVRKDMPVLADAKVRHRGDAVALVVATTQPVLAKALAAIGLDADPLPAVVDPVAATQPGAPLIHEDNPTGNVLLAGALDQGNAKAAMADCAAVAELELTLSHQEHAALEPPCGWAVFTPEDGLRITASTQTPFRDRAEVAESLGLDPATVRIIAPYCGGGFGAKDGITVQSLLGLAALYCPGQPVKMVWDRAETFLAGVKRHPARLGFRLGADADGTFKALEADITFDTGPYDHLGGVVMALGLEHAPGPYRIANIALAARAVYTNNPIGGAFRGFGVPQVTGAMEQAVDMLAAKLAMDPLDIRRRNALHRGDTNPIGLTLTGATGIGDCLDALNDHPLWRDKENWKAGAGPHQARGVGLACVMHGMGYGPVVPDVALAKIDLSDKGLFRVYGGVVDMGQGNGATYLQIAGQVLNQDIAHLELVLPDTARTLPSGSSSASRTTFTFGNALIQAAQTLKQRLLQRAADALMIGAWDQMALVPGAVRHLPSGRQIPLAVLASRLQADERIVVSRYRAPVAVERPAADQALQIHGIPHRIFSYGVHLAAVTVDRLTGTVTVNRYLAVQDCGRILNPGIYEQQVHGGVAQGIGYALFEDMAMAEAAIRAGDLTTYLIPGALDIPPIDSIAVELPETEGPYGMKGSGEICIDGPLAAVANAIADAGVRRCGRSPFDPAQVLDGLKNSDG